MKIDITKKYRTRDGRDVTLLHRLPEGWPTGYPLRGVVGGAESEWTDMGTYLPTIETNNDLIEIREPLECWVWVSDDDNLSDGAMTVRKPANQKYRRFREILD